MIRPNLQSGLRYAFKFATITLAMDERNSSFIFFASSVFISLEFRLLCLEDLLDRCFLELFELLLLPSLPFSRFFVCSSSNCFCLRSFSFVSLYFFSSALCAILSSSRRGCKIKLRNYSHNSFNVIWQCTDI